MLAHIDKVVINITAGDGKALLEGAIPGGVSFADWLKQPLTDTPFVAKATPTPPALGELWLGQGGYYAGIVRGEDGQPDYHLIVAHEIAGYHAGISWGAHGDDEPGATHERDGQANTAALVASARSHPAAEWAAALLIDGHQDFYLPARRELRLAWVNAPESFESGWYWSSTQCSRYDAWSQGFDDGLQSYDGKAYEGRARAVRRLPIQ